MYPSNRALHGNLGECGGGGGVVDGCPFVFWLGVASFRLGRVEAISIFNGGFKNDFRAVNFTFDFGSEEMIIEDFSFEFGIAVVVFDSSPLIDSGEAHLF